MRTLELIAALTLLAASPPAAAQVPHTFTTGTPAKASEVNENFAFLAAQAPAVYWKPSPTCGETACDVVATSSSWPNTSGYTELASLTVPAGSYLVMAKLATYAKSSVRNGDLECVVHVPGVAGDAGSVGLAPDTGGQKMLSMMIPLTTTGASTTVQLGCRLWGTQADGTSPLRAQIWGAKIIAVRVASVTQQ